MKLHFAFLVLPLLAIANPLAEPEPEPLPEALAEAFPEPLPLPAVRSSLQTSDYGPRTCKLTGSNLKYRKCPSTNNKKCPAQGEYGKKGTKVALKCWTVGSSVSGYAIWDKTSKGKYISEYYVERNCAYGLPQC